MIADVDKCFADGHAYVAISRAQSLEGLEIRHFKPGTVMTSAFVRLFYHHIDAGTLLDFYRQVDMWWKPVVEHPQRIPPIQGACTWKDLYERHPTFKGLQERHSQRWGRPQGEPLPDMVTWEARHGDQQNRRSKDTCFKCGQPGHWANKCTQAGDTQAGRSRSKDTCFKCGQPGHWANECTAGRQPPPSPSQPPPSLPSQPPSQPPPQPSPQSPSQLSFASPAAKRHCPTSASGAAATAAGEAATGGPLPQVAEASLSIRELKQELARRGIDCNNCIEKQELVQLLHDASVPASTRASPTPPSPVLASPAAAIATAATWSVPLPHDDRQVPIKGGAESVAEVAAARAEAELAKAEAVSAQQQAALAAAAAAAAVVAATASPARTPARRAPSNPATPRSAGEVRWRGPLAPASATRTEVAGAVEAVGTAAGTMQASLPSSLSKVRLTPKLADGRVPLELQAGMKLGRQKYGIADPRVSRHALELREGAIVVALHVNPLLVIRLGREPALVKKGESVQLRAGGELCLVVESHAPALGVSAGWAGNSCAFDVHII